MPANNSERATQRTLTGDTTEKERERPDTFVECNECGEELLRSELEEHEHDVYMRRQRGGGNGTQYQMGDLR